MQNDIAAYVPRHGTAPESLVARANTDWQRARKLLHAVRARGDGGTVIRCNLLLLALAAAQSERAA